MEIKGLRGQQVFTEVYRMLRKLGKEPVGLSCNPVCNPLGHPVGNPIPRHQPTQRKFGRRPLPDLLLL